MSSSSASDWVWHPEYGLYYLSSRHCWAKFDPEKEEWIYQPGQGATISDETRDSSNPEGAAAQYYEHSEEYAFENDDLAVLEDPTQPPNAETLRLVVNHSSCLPLSQTLVLLDTRPGGYSIGRDKAISELEGKIRLKEMEVSKNHATIYWEGDNWFVVDAGSVHGTWIKKKGKAKGKGDRISDSRAASLPFLIEHGDVLTIGSTVFEIHFHPLPAFPCSACAMSTTACLVPTAIEPKSGSQPKPINNYISSMSTSSGNGAAKAQLNQLKAKMLSHPSAEPLLSPGTNQHDSNTASHDESSAYRYQDRAALRRSIYPYRPTPPVAAVTPSLPTPPASSLQLAIDSQNKGHALLVRAGWSPGQAFGKAEDGRLEPVSVANANSGSIRRGLGAKKDEFMSRGSTEDWRDVGKRERWRDAQKDR